MGDIPQRLSDGSQTLLDRWPCGSRFVYVEFDSGSLENDSAGTNGDSAKRSIKTFETSHATPLPFQCFVHIRNALTDRRPCSTLRNSSTRQPACGLVGA